MSDGSLNFDTKIDSSGFDKGLSTIGGAFGKVESLFASLIKTTAALTTAATAAVGGIATYAVKTGSEFEAACSQIAATMGKTTDEISDLIAKAKEMGSTTAFSATEAAQGLNILAMSGLTAEEQMAAIGDVLNLAAAGTLSLEAAAAYTTGTIKGFADSMDNAQKYTDMIAKGATLANTDVNGLGEALSSSAATAKSYGQEADGVTLALLRLAEQNVTGAEAATALNRAMMDIYTPTDAAKKALDALGISAYDSTGKAKEFNTIVDELSAALSGMSDEEANATKNAIFTSYGLQAFNKMTVSSTEKVEEFRDGLAHASDGIGSAAQQAETMLDNLQGQITILKSGVDGLAISLYENMQEPLKNIAVEAQGMVTQLQSAFDEGGLEGLVSAAGDVLAQIVDRVGAEAPRMIEMASSLIESFINGIMNNLPSIASTGTQVITSLVTALIQNTGLLWSSAITIFAELLSGLAAQMPQLLETGKQAIAQIGQSLMDNAPSILSSAASIVKSIYEGLLSALPEIASAGVEILHSLTEGIQNNLPQMIPAAMNALVEFSGSLRENVGYLVDAGLDLILALASSLIDNIPVFIETIPTIITNICGIINDNAPKLLTAGIELIGKLAMGLIQAIPTLISNIPQIIQAVVSVFTAFNWLSIGKNIITFIADGIKGLATSIPNALKNIGQTALDWLKAIDWRTLGADIIDLIQIGIKSLLTAIPNLLKTIGTSAVNFFKGIDWADLGINLIKGIIAGITGALDGLWSAVTSFCGGIVDKVKDFFGIHSPSTVMAEQGDYLVQGLIEGIKEMPAQLAKVLIDTLAKVTEWGQQMLSDVQNSVQNVVQSAVQLISELPGKFWTWLTNVVTKTVAWGQQMLTTATTAISNMISSVISLMSELPGKFWTWFTNVVTKAVAWGQQMLTTATSAISNMISAVVALISELPDKFWTWFTNVVTKTTAWGQQMLNTAKSAISNMISAVVQLISELPDKIWTHLVNVVTKVTAWGQQMLSSAKTAISNMISSVVSLLSELPGKAATQLSNVVSKVVSWGSELASKGAAAAKGLFDAVVNGVSSLPSKMAEIGSNIVTGIWNGISSGWNWLKDKVSSLANSLLDSAKSALGINSPSRAFRDQVGHWIMPGVAEGMDASMPETLKHMKAQAGELVASMQAAVNANMGNFQLNAQSAAGARALTSAGTVVYADNSMTQENNYNVPVVSPSETAKANREAFRKFAGGVK